MYVYVDFIYGKIEWENNQGKYERLLGLNKKLE